LLQPLLPFLLPDFKETVHISSDKTGIKPTSLKYISVCTS